MDAIDRGLSLDEITVECPCAADLGKEAAQSESLRHSDMGWEMPTCFSDYL